MLKDINVVFYNLGYCFKIIYASLFDAQDTKFLVA